MQRFEEKQKCNETKNRSISQFHEKKKVFHSRFAYRFRAIMTKNWGVNKRRRSIDYVFFLFRNLQFSFSFKKSIE